MEDTLKDLIKQASRSSGATQRDLESITALALLHLALILNEMAGPYCGHGTRRKSCPYYHIEGE